MDFAEMLMILENYKLLDVLLPFMLIFTIVYAVLTKTNIMGEDRKNFNVVIALIMSLGVVIPHVAGMYPSEEADIVNIINKALPQVSIIMVAIIALLLMVGVFGHKLNFKNSSLASWLVVLSILVIGFIFTNAAGWWDYGWPNWLGWLNDPETQALLIILLVFGVIVAFITSDGKKDGGEGKSFGKFMKGFGDALE